MRSNTRVRPYSLSLAVAMALMMRPALIAATVDCTNGVTNPSSPLTDNYVTHGNSVSCIMLTNGASLDLNGHTITNDGLTVAPDAGIYCTAPSSLISNGSSTPATIGGLFVTGTKGCEKVEGITFDGAGPGVSGGLMVTAISNLGSSKASSIKNNVIKNCVSFGIDVSLLDSNSVVTNNTMSAQLHGMQVSGTTGTSGPLVEDNAITGKGCWDGSDGYVVGIIKGDTNKIRIRNNLLMHRKTTDTNSDCMQITTTGSTISGNVCDCDSECATSPRFALPWF